MRPIRIAVTALFALGLALTPVVAEECRAEINDEITHKNVSANRTHLQFEVEVSVQENCAEVHFEIVLDVTIPNGQHKKIRVPRFIKINDGSQSMMVEYELPEGQTLTGHESRITECSVCDLMP